MTVGENLAVSSGSEDYITFIQAWYDENADYDFSMNTCTAVCGHYTQVSLKL